MSRKRMLTCRSCGSGSAGWLGGRRRHGQVGQGGQSVDSGAQTGLCGVHYRVAQQAALGFEGSDAGLQLLIFDRHGRAG